MTVQIDFHGDAIAVNRSVYGNKLIACLKKAILTGDTTHGGNAEITKVTGTAVDYPQDDDMTEVSISLTVTVIYEELAGDPYTTT